MVTKNLFFVILLLSVFALGNTLQQAAYLPPTQNLILADEDDPPPEEDKDCEMSGGAWSCKDEIPHSKGPRVNIIG